MAGCGLGDIKKIVKMLKAAGWNVEVGKHYIATHPKGGRVVMALTPSDGRALNNIKADIKRIQRQHGELNNDRTNKHPTHRLLKPTETRREDRLPVLRQALANVPQEFAPYGSEEAD